MHAAVALVRFKLVRTDMPLLTIGDCIDLLCIRVLNLSSPNRERAGIGIEDEDIAI